jgi:hypothetical protein
MAKRIFAAILVVFLFPAALAVGQWYATDRPDGWRNADWESSGLLPPATASREAVVHIMAARTGGLKGALAVHAWIVLKRAGQGSYDRYEKVGWGTPVRKNAYSADGRWYSNDPFIVATITGTRAESLIPKIEAAIATYKFNFPGGYRIWPGPNSNTFVASVLRKVPEADVILPSNAVGRDYINGFAMDPDGRDFHLSLFGLAGIAFGIRSGLEIQLLGLVAGIDVVHPGIKIPAFGRVGI